jgi:hypothetical protein
MLSILFLLSDVRVTVASTPCTSHSSRPPLMKSQPSATSSIFCKTSVYLTDADGAQPWCTDFLMYRTLEVQSTYYTSELATTTSDDDQDGFCNDVCNNVLALYLGTVN